MPVWAWSTFFGWIRRLWGMIRTAMSTIWRALLRLMWWSLSSKRMPTIRIMSPCGRISLGCEPPEKAAAESYRSPHSRCRPPCSSEECDARPATPTSISPMRFVLLPTFGTASDARAIAILDELLPGREVVGIPARDLVVGLGSVHCLTQQEPSRETQTTL